MFKLPHQRPLPARHRILYVLRSARGAIDLASIMVGVIILGLITTDNASHAVLLSTTGDNIAILLNAGGTRYVAVSRSATGERFFLASRITLSGYWAWRKD